MSQPNPNYNDILEAVHTNGCNGSQCELLACEDLRDELREALTQAVSKAVRERNLEIKEKVRKVMSAYCSEKFPGFFERDLMNLLSELTKDNPDAN